jgi:hypothetical protein
MGKSDEESLAKVVASGSNGHAAMPINDPNHLSRIRDPYAIRAMERVKTKLRSRMVEISRGG